MWNPTGHMAEDIGDIGGGSPRDAADIFEMRNLLKQNGYNNSKINTQLQELIRQNKATGGFDK
jgi:DNA/RNA endonuclease G (NUC1)